MTIEYIIEKKDEVYTLYSSVPTKVFGKPSGLKAKNYICEGTEEYCMAVKAKVEKALKCH